MNILQVISKLDAGWASEDIMCSTRYFTLNGHKVVVACEENAFFKEIDTVGARHYTVPMRPNVITIFKAILRLSQIISRENIDIIHARDGISSLCAFFAARFTERVFVSTIYKDAKPHLLGKAQFWAKRVICFNKKVARNILKKEYVSRTKISIIPPFVDTHAKSKRNLPPDYFVIGASLPLSSQEATKVLVKTISTLSRAAHKIKVLVINSSLQHEKTHIERFKLLVKRHSLDSVISVAAHTDLANEVAGLDLFIQIDDKDHTQLRFLLKAASLGVPVITTDSDLVIDYLENEDIFTVCRRKEPQVLANKILSFYRDRALMKKTSDETIAFVKNKFSLKTAMESTLNVYNDALKARDILIIKIGAIGDAILVIPSVRAIRERFGSAKIKLLVGVETREIFMNCPLIDEMIVCDFKKRDRGLRGLLRVAKALRSENFDTVIDFQNNKKSHLLSFLSFIPKRYGYDNGKLSFLLNRKVKDTPSKIDPIEHQSRVLGLLGIHDIDKRLELWTSADDEKWAESFLSSHWVKPALSKKSEKKENLRLIALNIGASSRWVTKLWPVEYFAEVANRLAKDCGARIILIGREKRNTYMDDFLKRTRCKPIIAAGKTNIPRLASLVRRCSILLSSDSAPVHVAASVDTPFIALFGPTDPERHIVPTRDSIVIRKDFPCSPCYHTHCDRGYVCMREITPDEVYDKVLELLKTVDQNSKVKKV